MHPTIRSLIDVRSLLEFVEMLLIANGLGDEITTYEIRSSKAIGIERDGIKFWFDVDLEHTDVGIECYVYPAADDDPDFRCFGLESTDGGKTWRPLIGKAGESDYARDGAGRWIDRCQDEVHAAIGLGFDPAVRAGTPKSGPMAARQGALTAMTTLITNFAKLPRRPS